MTTGLVGSFAKMVGWDRACCPRRCALPKRKKRFDCGHLGFGRYCRPCEEKRRARAARQASKESRRRLLEESPVPLESLPKIVQDKALKVVRAIADGSFWGSLGGKQLSPPRGGRVRISIPLGQRYRILFEYPEEGRPPRPLCVLSHEEYNGIVKRA